MIARLGRFELCPIKSRTTWSGIKSHLSLFGDTTETMSTAQVHYELFIRRSANVGWTLQFATEDRTRCLESAEQLMAESKAVAVRVTKETLDPETREFRSVTVLSKGMTEMVKPLDLSLIHI